MGVDYENRIYDFSIFIELFGQQSFQNAKMGHYGYFSIGFSVFC